MPRDPQASAPARPRFRGPWALPSREGRAVKAPGCMVAVAPRQQTSAQPSCLGCLLTRHCIYDKPVWSVSSCQNALRRCHRTNSGCAQLPNKIGAALGARSP